MRFWELVNWCYLNFKTNSKLSQEMLESVKKQPFLETIEFKLVVLLVLLIKKTFLDFKDLFLDLLRVNPIFSKKNSMTSFTKQLKRKFLNLFISLYIGKEHTSKIKSKEFVILSKVKDMSFQLWINFKNN